MQDYREFYRGKTVLVTGHTGFKGAWMCRVLDLLGARVIGYALTPPTEPNLFTVSGIEQKITSVTGDVRDLEHLKQVFAQYRPEIVIHMAAQPIVRESYRDPVATYDTNVMGTVNVMEAVRLTDSVRSFVNVTTDKVYRNNEWEWGYREDDVLDGYDPYSNSKSCSELVTSSYRKAFFGDGRVSISTCRAGNVIGGGDFASDRIIPDCVRAMEAQRSIVVRNPYSTRPYQHVLEPVCAYLMVAACQEQDAAFAGSYNVGPDDCDCVTTGALADLFCRYWGDGAAWENVAEKNAPHEANFLKLDCARIKKVFGWAPVWHMEETMARTVEWYQAWLRQEDVVPVMERQIREYLEQ